MGLSIRAYARHRGMSDTAVHKAIRTGRIPTEADGTIDVDKADQAWELNTEIPKTGARQGAVRVKLDQPDSLSNHTGNPNSTHTNSTTLLQAKTANEVVKAQTNKLRLSQLKGELVDRSLVVTQVFKLARQERDAWLNWPGRVAAQLAASLDVDAHRLHVLLESAVRDHLLELGQLQITLED